MSDERTPEIGEAFEVTELDDKELEDVAGGNDVLASNGNCSCPVGSSAPAGYTNGNCSCTGSGSGGEEAVQ
jgi:hypothetical protein